MIINNAYDNNNRGQWVLHRVIGAHHSPQFKKINFVGRNISVTYYNYMHYSEPTYIQLKSFFISGVCSVSIKKNQGYYVI